MTNLTVTENYPITLFQNNVAIVQAPNGDGSRLLLEVEKWSKGLEFTKPQDLKYIAKSKAWTDNFGRPLLFNIADNEKEVVSLVSRFFNDSRGNPPMVDSVTKPLEALIMTDTGTYLVSDVNDQSVFQVDKAY